MSARKKVAREAVFDAMIEYGPDGHTDGHDKITDAALSAADSVLFGEAAIERAAEVLYEAAPYVRMLRGNAAVQWYSLSEDQKKLARTQARAVVAALREEA